MHFFIRAQTGDAEEGKDPAEDGLDLPRNVTRTNYTSRELPGRASSRTMYVCVGINVHPQTRRQTYAYFDTVSLSAHGELFPVTCSNTLLRCVCEGTATPIPSRQPPPVLSRRTIPPIRYAPTFEIVESFLRNQRDVSLRPFARPARSTASSRGFLFTVRFAKPSATEEFTTDSGSLYLCDPRRANTRPGE